MRDLPTRWRQKSTGIDVEQNCVTVARVCVRTVNRSTGTQTLQVGNKQGRSAARVFLRRRRRKIACELYICADARRDTQPDGENKEGRGYCYDAATCQT